jgi:hypothetical protein
MKRMKHTTEPSTDINKVTTDADIMAVELSDSEAKKSYDEAMDALSTSQKATVIDFGNQIQDLLIDIKRNSFDIGRMLFAVKSIIPPRYFESWIQHFFKNDLKPSTARFYMRIYKAFKGCPQKIQDFPSETLLMMTQDHFPEEMFKMLTDQTEKIQPAQLNEVKSVWTNLKNGKIEKNVAIKLAEEHIAKSAQMKFDRAMGKTRRRINSNEHQLLELGIANMCKQIRAVRELARDYASMYPYDPESPDHKKLMKEIDEVIIELHQLKDDLEDRGRNS